MGQDSDPSPFVLELGNLLCIPMDKPIQTTRVSNKTVRAIPHVNDDKRPIKGMEVCPYPFANIALIGAKELGKTSIINTLLKECLGRDTAVIAFVSTLYNDASWETIAKWVEAKGHPFVGYTTMMEGKINRLEAFVSSLQKKHDGEGREDEEVVAGPKRKVC